MQFSRYYILMASNVYFGLSMCSDTKFEPNLISFDDNQTINSTKQSDVDTNAKHECLLCGDLSIKLNNGDYPANHSSLSEYMNRYLKSKDFQEYFKKSREVKCPICKSDFDGDSHTYKRNFIKRLLIDPRRDMIDIFEQIVFSYNIINKLLDDIFICNDIKYDNCKKILDWTKNTKSEFVLRFSKILSEKVLEMANQKIDAAAFSKLFEISESSNNTSKFLHDNFDTIKLLTEMQIRILLESKAKYIIWIKDFGLFYENIFSSDENIKKSIKNLEEAYSISMVLLYIGSDKSFKLFIKLNGLFKQNDQYRKEKLFEKFSNTYSSSESYYKYTLEVLRTINLLISRALKVTKKIDSEKIMYDFFLKVKEVNSKEKFSDDFIMDAIEESLNMSNSAIYMAIRSYFENDLYSKKKDSLNSLLEKLSLESKGYYFMQTDEGVLSYLIKKLEEKNLVGLLSESVIYKLIYLCFEFKINAMVLTPFVDFIKKNLFTIATNPCVKKDVRDLFHLLRYSEATRRKDYEFFDLSSDFFLKNSGYLSKLCDILKSEDVYPALEIVCSETKFLEKFSIVDREMLRELIHVIIKQPNKDKLFNIVASRLYKGFHYLIKLYLIDFSVKLVLEDKYGTKRNIFNEGIVQYITKNIKKTPSLAEKMNSVNFNLLEYLKPENIKYDILIDEIPFNLQNIKKRKLIGLCYDLFMEKRKSNLLSYLIN